MDNRDFFSFKCKYCGGGVLTKAEGSRFIGKCKYCGRIQTLPHPHVENIAELFDIAESFRRNKEFDKADALYEQILRGATDDPEIYWMRVLCRYGVEYVEDPGTHERKPTVHRMRYDSVFADANYKKTMQYADDDQKKVYEQEARSINEIVGRYIELLPKVHFKVFICYKETDEYGRRTDDSKYAEGLYNLLTKKGIEAFYAGITLQSQPGTVYEPYIFAALNSANVMVVIGSRQEYFEAVWVKNEWSRYLSLVNESGSQKLLIPAVINMNPYELPKELLHLQAKDVSNPRSMDDLVYDIERIINGIESVEVILKRGYGFLTAGNWQSAESCFKQALDREPQNAEAYMGLLMKEYRICERSQIGECREAFEKSKYFRAIQEYGSADIKHELNRYLLMRAYSFLKCSDWKSAKNGFKNVLDREPDSADARLGLLLAEYCLGDKTQLAICKAAFYRNPYFQWLQAHGSAQLKSELDEYTLKHAYGLLRDRNWHEAKECLNGLLIRNPQSSDIYLGLLLEECRACDKAQLANCKKTFDGSIYFQWLQINGSYELKAELNAYLEKIKTKQKKAKQRLGLIIAAAIGLAVIVGALVIVLGDVFDFNQTDNSPWDDGASKGAESQGTFTSGNYTYEVVDGEAIIIAVDPLISGYEIIPSKLGGYKVTAIGDGAFAECMGLTGVEIPEGVESIGDRAFYYCSYYDYDGYCYGLQYVYIPESVTKIGKYAFANSCLVEIEYGGTKAQWNEIAKGSSWYDYTFLETVYCTNGEIYF